MWCRRATSGGRSSPRRCAGCRTSRPPPSGLRVGGGTSAATTPSGCRSGMCRWPCSGPSSARTGWDGRRSAGGGCWRRTRCGRTRPPTTTIWSGSGSSPPNSPPWSWWSWCYGPGWCRGGPAGSRWLWWYHRWRTSAIPPACRSSGRRSSPPATASSTPTSWLGPTTQPVSDIPTSPISRSTFCPPWPAIRSARAHR